jgi:hypothetical protein
MAPADPEFIDVQTQTTHDGEEVMATKTIKFDRSKKRNRPSVVVHFPALRETERYVYVTDARQDILYVIKLLNVMKKQFRQVLKEQKGKK